MANYFTGGQADLFSFYRLPKILFADPRFRTGLLQNSTDKKMR